MISEEAIQYHAERNELARQNAALREVVLRMTVENEALQRTLTDKIVEVKHLRGLEQDTYNTWKDVAHDLTAERDAALAEIARLRADLSTNDSVTPDVTTKK